jgi:hypothetical protein
MQKRNNENFNKREENSDMMEGNKHGTTRRLLLFIIALLTSYFIWVS